MRCNENKSRSCSALLSCLLFNKNIQIHKDISNPKLHAIYSFAVCIHCVRFGFIVQITFLNCARSLRAALKLFGMFYCLAKNAGGGLRLLCVRFGIVARAMYSFFIHEYRWRYDLSDRTKQKKNVEIKFNCL